MQYLTHRASVHAEALFYYQLMRKSNDLSRLWYYCSSDKRYCSWEIGFVIGVGSRAAVGELAGESLDNTLCDEFCCQDCDATFPPISCNVSAGINCPQGK